jgi:hypothetical protein
MCGCFVILLGSAFPRLTLILIWLFSDLMSRAFDTWVLPFFGILLLPYTTLAYVLVFWFTDYTPVEGFGWAFVVLGLVFDISSYSAAGQNRRAVSA